jgi:hypothetical protein
MFVVKQRAAQISLHCSGGSLSYFMASDNVNHSLPNKNEEKEKPT